jgi:TonB family protein
MKTNFTRVHMTCLTAALLVFAIGRAAFAQAGAFSGDVKDSATHAPLPKLQVFLLDEKRHLVGWTVTDERGLFVIPHKNPGIFHLEFARLGMKPVSGPVDTASADSVISRSYTASFVANPPDSVLTEYEFDEPPTPLPDFQDPPRYPRSLQRYPVQGIVKLSFVVDTTGHVDITSVNKVGATDGAFFRAVMDALPRMAFSPARLRGQKVRARVNQTFTFNAPRAR